MSTERHCKSPAHLAVVHAPPDATAFGVGVWVGVFVNMLGCVNAGQYDGPGVIISKAGRPVRGMHLLPDAARWLPGELRTAAGLAGADGTVIIEHTISAVLEEWNAFTAGAAFALADSIETAAGRLP